MTHAELIKHGMLDLIFQLKNASKNYPRKSTTFPSETAEKLMQIDLKLDELESQVKELGIK